MDISLSMPSCDLIKEDTGADRCEGVIKKGVVFTTDFCTALNQHVANRH
jgi:hypothetical protein